MKKRRKKFVKKKYQVRDILLVTTLFIILILSLRFDSSIVRFINGLRNPFLDAFMLWITYAGSTLVILFTLTSLFMWHEHKRKWILPLWLSLFFTVVVTTLLKLLVQRTRPFVFGLNSMQILTEKLLTWSSSFPSSHSAVAFSALPVLDKEFPYFRFVWFGFAILVAFSRVYFALHYLSDVIAGALLGYGIGLVFTKLEERYKYGKIWMLRKR